MASQVKHDIQPGADSDHALSGRYELRRRVINHNTCQLYEAFDRILERTVAVKVLTDKRCEEDDLQRFERGASIASSIVHPNVAQVLDFGTSRDGRPYMVMEFVKGITLRKWIESEGPLPPTLAIRLAIQILDGLSATHREGIVHRDLKTANIIVDGLDSSNPRTCDLQTKIVDFGIAKTASQGKANDTSTGAAKPITKQGQVVGSPVYMSPEQVRGLPLDARSDIYAAGCILFELLTGEALFLGKTAFETMGMHVYHKPPTLRETLVNVNFPIELEEIVAKAVAKDSADRYQSARELRDALMAVLEKYKTIEQMRDTDSFINRPSPQRLNMSGETMVIGDERKPVSGWILAFLLTLSVGLIVIGLAIISYIYSASNPQTTALSPAKQSASVPNPSEDVRPSLPAGTIAAPAK